jgi:membrane-associated HD superfamily phosphohydrolase
MVIKSLSDIPSALFYRLKTWAEYSNANWNLLLGIGMLLLIFGIALVYVYTKKIGKEDEHSQKIYYISVNAILLTIVFLDILFPKDYMWNQFFLYKYALAFIVSGLSLVYQYRKQFL